MDDQAIIARAYRAHLLNCRRRGVIYMQPAQRSCRVVEHRDAWYAILANGCGAPEDTLAVYQLHGNPAGDYRLQGVANPPHAVLSL